MSAAADTVRRARAALVTRERDVPPARRLAQLDALERQLLAADVVDMRAYVVALQVLDLATQERHQAAELERSDRRRAAATAAGQARAAQLDGVDVAACRAWARSQGLDVPAAGRFLPRAVVDAWRAAEGAA